MSTEKTMQTNTKAGAFDYLTPLYLIESLGSFDLDPCGWPGHKTAEVTICMPKDGLACAWLGRVWLNPPFGGEETQWLNRLEMHGDGIAIVPSRTDAGWFQTFAPSADACFFLKDRVYYLRPGEEGGKRPSFGSVLLAWGAKNAKAIYRSGLAGIFLNP